MTAIIMAVLAIPIGVFLDRWIARLALERYLDEDDEPGPTLASEAAAISAAPHTGDAQIPRALTTLVVQRRVIVIATTVLALGLVGWRYDGEPLHAAIVGGYASALIVCTGTDVLAYRVPNVVTYPAILAALVLGMVLPDSNRVDVLLGGLVTGGMFLAMMIATRGGMGMGDVKLALFIGLALGLALGVMALLFTAIVGGVIAVLLMVTRLRSRRDPIPYAPFLAAGALFVMLVHGTAFAAL